METTKRSWKFFLAKGILYIVLGIIAMIVPKLFTIKVELVIGWLFVIGGIVQAFRTFQRRGTPDFTTALILTIVYLIAGIFLLLDPEASALTFAILLIAFFVIEGVAKIVLAFQMIRWHYWYWLAISGLISLILAAVMIANGLDIARWAVGFLVGINLFILGISEVAMAMAIHRNQP